MPSNETIVQAAGTTTGDVLSGLLLPEQARQFIRQASQGTALGGLVRHEMRRAKTGEIDKIGIASRVVRKKTENIDANADGGPPMPDLSTGQAAGYRAKPVFGHVSYATKAVRLPWEITEETLRETIEGQSLEDTITQLMTAQLGADMEDLWLNGDTQTPVTDPNRLFLYINDGWIKRIAAGGHVVDASGSAEMRLDLFYDAVAALPNKFNNGRLRWLMSPHRAQAWERTLFNHGLSGGGSFPDSLFASPASIPSIQVPAMPDSVILLTDPRNLVVVNSYDVKIRKTTEGREAVLADKRFYVIHLDFDSVVEELSAAAIIEKIG